MRKDPIFNTVIGALKNASKKMSEGISPTEALELTVKEMELAAATLDANMNSGKGKTHLLIDDIAKGDFSV